MNPIKTRKLTRQQIGEFIGSPRGVRAFEAAQDDITDQYDALTTASFITLTTEPTLGAERVLALDGDDLESVDGGPNSNFTISLKPTGITADTYGDAAHFVSITVDEKGRIAGVQEYPATGSAGGTATLDFGAFPGANEASVSFADTDILASSKVKAWFASDSSTADHTAGDHKYAPLFISLSAEADDGVGGVIYARSEHKMQGLWSVQWEWS